LKPHIWFYGDSFAERIPVNKMLNYPRYHDILEKHYELHTFGLGATGPDWCETVLYNNRPSDNSVPHYAVITLSNLNREYLPDVQTNPTDQLCWDQSDAKIRRAVAQYYNQAQKPKKYSDRWRKMLLNLRSVIELSCFERVIIFWVFTRDYNISAPHHHLLLDLPAVHIEKDFVLMDISGSDSPRKLFFGSEDIRPNHLNPHNQQVMAQYIQDCIAGRSPCKDFKKLTYSPKLDKWKNAQELDVFKKQKR